jgi:uncharacterized Tic20 family protein
LLLPKEREEYIVVRRGLKEKEELNWQMSMVVVVLVVWVLIRSKLCYTHLNTLSFMDMYSLLG